MAGAAASVARRLTWLCSLVVAVAVFTGVAGASTATVSDPARTDVLTLPAALVLGVVEGVTEFLPVSSTGHLLVTSRLLDLPLTGRAGETVKSYDVAIQLGAILAVAVLYRRRLAAMLRGAFGKDEAGRRLTGAVAVAAAPAGISALVAEPVIKGVLFGVWPVVAAWFVGGVGLLLLRPRLDAATEGRLLEAISVRDALVVGAAQVLALWPGTSRSLVTIVAALLVGLSLAAAVEFSFVLGLVTLGAATIYEGVSNGEVMVATLGLGVPLVGVAAAFVTAVVTLRWLLAYLTSHGLGIFGWYRIGVAVAATGLAFIGAI